MGTSGDRQWGLPAQAQVRSDPPPALPLQTPESWGPRPSPVSKGYTLDLLKPLAALGAATIPAHLLEPRAAWLQHVRKW